jgi:hypothetical protein
MPLFEKVLIANRGEIARRVIRTCKRLGIRTVAVYSEADAEFPHVSDADEAVLLGPPPAKDSYLNVDAILAAITKTGATAVHPGYGFLSEKSGFARAVAALGVTFIGPSPDTLDAFGDKIKARHVAVAAGTQPVPGTDEPIAIETAEQIADVKARIAAIGYPVVVKAVGVAEQSGRRGKRSGPRRSGVGGVQREPGVETRAARGVGRQPAGAARLVGVVEQSGRRGKTRGPRRSSLGGVQREPGVDTRAAGSVGRQPAGAARLVGVVEQSGRRGKTSGPRRSGLAGVQRESGVEPKAARGVGRQPAGAG